MHYEQCRKRVVSEIAAREERAINVDNGALAGERAETVGRREGQAGSEFEDQGRKQLTRNLPSFFLPSSLSRLHLPRRTGGRGLPLSEIPSCPGRFVLSGTCRGGGGAGANKTKNAARSRHNVRAALAAFEALGGVRGVWLRGEEAVVGGDHEVSSSEACVCVCMD